MLKHIIILSITITAAIITATSAQENRLSIRGTGLDIPRFVTLKSNLVNMRSGPGKEYPVKWQYHRKGLPLKVIGEFDVWREVMDHDNTTGWMHVSTLSIKRMALITETTVKIHRSDDENSRILAVAEKGIIAELEHCRKDWCKIKTPNLSGWLYRQAIWGLLDDEPFN
jgi:SH3-like domain-containing protein